MALIDDIKKYLRITGTDFDTEITDLISAAQSDLSNVGIVVTDTTNALVKRAISMYCKAYFGYDNADADRFIVAYDNIKSTLALSTSYAYYTVTFTLTAQNYITFNGETKWTDSSGEAVFYSKTGSHLPYSIGGGSDIYIDVTTDTEVDLT